MNHDEAMKTDMAWKEKQLVLEIEYQYLGSQNDLKRLKAKALSEVGSTDLEVIESRALENSIEYYLKQAKAHDIVLHPVDTSGTPCSIMSSHLYLEVGVLIFNGYGGDRPIHLLGRDRNTSRRRIGMVCCCCSPYMKGVQYARASGIAEINEWRKSNARPLGIDELNELRKSFVRSIRESCQKHGVTNLYAQCYENLMTQDKDGLHLMDLRNFGQGLDHPRFADAFKQVGFETNDYGAPEHTTPFRKLFVNTPRPYRRHEGCL